MLEWALDESFKLTYVDEANSSIHKYFCPACRQFLDVKNRDFEDRTKAKHFAHSFGRVCKNPNNESDLHLNTKLLLYEKLLKKEFNIFVKAKIGENPQYIEIDLKEGVDEVLLEAQTIENFMPDISLLQKNKLIKAVEVIHKHDDTVQKTQAYERSGIKVFKFFTSELTYKRLKRGSEPVFFIGKQPLAFVLRS